MTITQSRFGGSAEVGRQHHEARSVPRRDSSSSDFGSDSKALAALAASLGVGAGYSQHRHRIKHAGAAKAPANRLGIGLGAGAVTAGLGSIALAESRRPNTSYRRVRRADYERDQAALMAQLRERGVGKSDSPIPGSAQRLADPDFDQRYEAFQMAQEKKRNAGKAARDAEAKAKAAARKRIQQRRAAASDPFAGMREKIKADPKLNPVPAVKARSKGNGLRIPRSTSRTTSSIPKAGGWKSLVAPVGIASAGGIAGLASGEVF